MNNSVKQIEEVLRNEGTFVSTTSGMSMYPMLRDRKDTIIIEPYEGRLKKFDVPLYRSGGKYILHRIIKVTPNGYVIRGDNCDKKEYGITDHEILGVLTGFYRGEKKVDMKGLGYQMYVQLYCRAFLLQWILRRLRSLVAKVRRVIRKVGKNG